MDQHSHTCLYRSGFFFFSNGYLPLQQQSATNLGATPGPESFEGQPVCCLNSVSVSTILIYVKTLIALTSSHNNYHR